MICVKLRVIEKRKHTEFRTLWKWKKWKCWRQTIHRPQRKQSNFSMRNLFRTLKFTFHLNFRMIIKMGKIIWIFASQNSEKKMSDSIFLSFYFYIFDLENWKYLISYYTLFRIFTEFKYKYFFARKLICRFRTQDFIQISKEWEKNQTMEFFCAFHLRYVSCVYFWFNLIPANFTFIDFGNFGILVDGVFHSACAFFSSSFLHSTRYQVHQKFLLLSVKSDEFFWFGYEFESE